MTPFTADAVDQPCTAVISRGARIRVAAPTGAFIPNTARHAHGVSLHGDLLLPKPKTSAHQRWWWALISPILR
jgi:hypothetical protein